MIVNQKLTFNLRFINIVYTQRNEEIRLIKRIFDLQTVIIGPSLSKRLLSNFSRLQELPWQ